MEDTKKQSRREFCIQTCQAATLLTFGGALGAILEGCSSGNPFASGEQLDRIQTTVTNQTITLTIDASSPLSPVGGAALVQGSGRSVLVARTAQDTFVAVTAICTHESCTITGFSNQVYTCPCHGSQFGVNGNVMRGPAATSLGQFQTQFANDQLTITLP
jgi:cytochrome b6-f complex iron-sulfur subunit